MQRLDEELESARKKLRKIGAGRPLKNETRNALPDDHSAEVLNFLICRTGRECAHMAQIFGVHHSTLYRWINGESRIGNRHVWSLALLLAGSQPESFKSEINRRALLFPLIECQVPEIQNGEVPSSVFLDRLTFTFDLQKGLEGQFEKAARAWAGHKQRLAPDDNYLVRVNSPEERAHVSWSPIEWDDPETGEVRRFRRYARIDLQSFAAIYDADTWRSPGAAAGLLKLLLPFADPTTLRVTRVDLAVNYFGVLTRNVVSMDRGLRNSGVGPVDVAKMVFGRSQVHGAHGSDRYGQSYSPTEKAFARFWEQNLPYFEQLWKRSRVTPDPEALMFKMARHFEMGPLHREEMTVRAKAHPEKLIQTMANPFAKFCVVHLAAVANALWRRLFALAWQDAHVPDSFAGT